MEIKRTTDFVKGQEGYLMEALNKLQVQVRETEILSDQKGMFALNLSKPRIVLCAKSYIYGDIVSAHKRAVYAALNQKKPLVMYIGHIEKFYSFKSEELINSQENLRGGTPMLNWNIKLGRRYYEGTQSTNTSNNRKNRRKH